jgi:hypothetical protein
MRSSIMRLTLLGLAALCAALAGCAKDDYLRTEGLTETVGDSIAHNNALQIIDPWPEGVEDTDLDVPADRGGPVPAGGGATPPATGGANP